jgi:SAM-dependent methyltransferase
MRLLDRIHEGYVFGRRLRRLSGHLGRVIPPNSHVLDVGCGDGRLAALTMKLRQDITFKGIDVLVRPNNPIPVDFFDGAVIPFDNGSFDVVMFVDVLHHTEDPMILLREAVRVARRAIVIKDHTADGILAVPTLSFMDRVGNARHGVALPYNYWSGRQWHEAFQSLGLIVDIWEGELGIYPKPADFLFGRSLHFLTRLCNQAASLFP